MAASWIGLGGKATATKKECYREADRRDAAKYEEIRDPHALGQAEARWEGGDEAEERDAECEGNQRCGGQRVRERGRVPCDLTLEYFVAPEFIGRRTGG